jgi:hypothetical protein
MGEPDAYDAALLDVTQDHLLFLLAQALVRLRLRRRRPTMGAWRRTGDGGSAVGRVLAGISLGCDTVTDAYLLKTR